MVSQPRQPDAAAPVPPAARRAHPGRSPHLRAGDDRRQVWPAADRATRLHRRVGFDVARDRIAGWGRSHPAWLYNLARHPEATIEFAEERRVPVRAETLAG